MKIKYKSFNHLQMTSSYKGCVAITTKGRRCGHTIFDDIRQHCKTHAHKCHEYLQHIIPVSKLTSFHEYTEVYDSIIYTVTTQDIHKVGGDALVMITLEHDVTIGPATSEQKARGIKYIIGIPIINYVPLERYKDLTGNEQHTMMHTYGNVSTVNTSLCNILQKYPDIHTLAFVISKLHLDVIDSDADINVSIMTYHKNLQEIGITQITFVINSEIENLYSTYYRTLKDKLHNGKSTQQIISKDISELEIGYQENIIIVYPFNTSLNVKADTIAEFKIDYSPNIQIVYGEEFASPNKYNAKYEESITIPSHKYRKNDGIYDLTSVDFAPILTTMLEYDAKSIIFNMFPSKTTEYVQLSPQSIHTLITMIKSQIVENKWKHKMFKFVVYDGATTSVFDTWYHQLKTTFASPRQQVETPPIVPAKPTITIPMVGLTKGTFPIVSTKPIVTIPMVGPTKGTFPIVSTKPIVTIPMVGPTKGTFPIVSTKPIVTIPVLGQTKGTLPIVPTKPIITIPTLGQTKGTLPIVPTKPIITIPTLGQTKGTLPIVPAKPIITIPTLGQTKGTLPIVPTIPIPSTNINPVPKIAVQHHQPIITRTPIIYTTAPQVNPKVIPIQNPIGTTTIVPANITTIITWDDPSISTKLFNKETWIYNVLLTKSNTDLEAMAANPQTIKPEFWTFDLGLQTTIMRNVETYIFWKLRNYIDSTYIDIGGKYVGQKGGPYVYGKYTKKDNVGQGESMVARQPYDPDIKFPFTTTRLTLPEFVPGRTANTIPDFVTNIDKYCLSGNQTDITGDDIVDIPDKSQIYVGQNKTCFVFESIFSRFELSFGLFDNQSSRVTPMYPCDYNNTPIHPQILRDMRRVYPNVGFEKKYPALHILLQSGKFLDNIYTFLELTRQLITAFNKVSDDHPNDAGVWNRRDIIAGTWLSMICSLAGIDDSGFRKYTDIPSSPGTNGSQFFYTCAMTAYLIKYMNVFDRGSGDLAWQYGNTNVIIKGKDVCRPCVTQRVIIKVDV
jgi:hypothetical protein